MCFYFGEAQDLCQIWRKKSCWRSHHFDTWWLLAQWTILSRSMGAEVEDFWIWSQWVNEVNEVKIAIRQSNSDNSGILNQNWIFWKFPKNFPLSIYGSLTKNRVGTGQVGYEKMQSQMAYVSKWFGRRPLAEALVLSRCSKPIVCK